MDLDLYFPSYLLKTNDVCITWRCNEIFLDGEQAMKANNVVRLPSNMVHEQVVGGFDALDILACLRTIWKNKKQHWPPFTASFLLMPK
jgi:hypothetical protein